MTTAEQPDPSATCFVYCPGCRVLFTGLRGAAFIHQCGPTIGRSNFETTSPPMVELPVEFARKVVRVP